MALKDVLLQFSSYPNPPSVTAIEHAVDFAATMGAHISALAIRVEIPGIGNPLAMQLLDIPGMVAAEREKSVANARTLLAAFEAAAARRGLRHQTILESCTTSEVPALVTEHARMHDVTIIPIGGEQGLQQYVAESVVFGSGRPAIILPETPGAAAPLAFDVVAVAWDFSRPAARAIADALPILERARTVRVVTVTREKTIETRRSYAELVQHLGFHGIDLVVDEEEAAGRTIGQALEDYAARHQVGLLVMGAYGHSRVRDFILGGATKTVIAHPKLPVFLSH